MGSSSNDDHLDLITTLDASELTQSHQPQCQDNGRSLTNVNSQEKPGSGRRPCSLDDSSQGPVFFVSEPDASTTQYNPWSSHWESRTSTRRCNCQCICGSTTGFKIKENARVSEDTTSNNLSWRLLHMSRAKLKGSATTSQLIAGFAMVSLVNMTIHRPTLVPEWLFVVFTVTNTSLVSVHIFALMISTYILPNIDAIFKIRHKDWVTEAPHESMRRFIDLAWTFSTVFGLFLFLLEVAVICWIQLMDFSFTASLVGSLIIGPVLVIFIVVIIHFYKNLIVYEDR